MVHSLVGQVGLMFGVPLHILLVHFPITLATVAFGYDAWALYTQRPLLHRVASSLGKLAALSAVAATVTGLDLAGISGLGNRSSVTGHAALALLTTFVLALTAIIRYSVEMRSDREREALPSSLLVGEFFGMLLVLTTAIMGHRI